MMWKALASLPPHLTSFRRKTSPEAKKQFHREITHDDWELCRRNRDFVESAFHVSTLFCFNYEMPKSVRKKARPRGRIVMEALGWKGDVKVSPLLGCFGAPRKSSEFSARLSLNLVAVVVHISSFPDNNRRSETFRPSTAIMSEWEMCVTGKTMPTFGMINGVA